MEQPTEKQQKVFEFFQACYLEGRPMPTMREICHEFGFRSPRSATEHVEALVKKGLIEKTKGRGARSLRIKNPPVAGIPLLGFIPAGMPVMDAELFSTILPLQSVMFGIADSTKAFALTVKGDSMEGRHLLDGDTAILEAEVEARPGDIVAALIDQGCTLKTFVREKSKNWLRAENPRYPDLIPLDELAIQGVLRGLLRTERWRA